MFREVPRDKISLNIMRQMRDAVLSGRLHPGDRLPPENELLNEFGVSRHTLREALRALEVMGLIDIRKGVGGGPVVSEVDMETTCNSIANFLHFKNISITDLMEVRRIFEPYLARIAAERLGPEQIEKLRAMNQACRAKLDSGEDITGRPEEINFHSILAGASGNPVLILILNFVNSLLTDVKLQLKPGKEFSEQVLAAHERILEAIEERDGGAALSAMADHVCDVEQTLQNLRSPDESAD